MSPGKNRILVDGVYLGTQMKGVGRYSANTLRHLASLDAINEYHILVHQNVPLPPLPQNSRFHYVPVPLHNHYFHGWWILPQYARRLRADLVLVPYETTLSVFPCPYLVVCHDVPPLISRAQQMAGSHVSPPRRIIDALDLFLVRRSLRNASVVFANSHFVGSWLHDGLGIPAERVRYAPCAPGADFVRLAQSVDHQAVRRELNCPHGYVLVFATGDQRENLDTVLRVFDGLVAQGLALNLVIAGVRENDNVVVRAQVSPYAWSNRVRVLPFYGEDRMMDLAEVYAAASVYLDLSLHEGFGMQVIEAMACGSPVVCSNRGALPEVSGEAAMLVDPFDFEVITDAVRQVIANVKLEETLLNRGRARAAQYTWEQTARTILEQFENLE